MIDLYPAAYNHLPSCWFTESVGQLSSYTTIPPRRTPMLRSLFLSVFILFTLVLCSSTEVRVNPVGVVTVIKLTLDLHVFRIPFIGTSIEVAQVCEQGRARRTEAEHSILNHRFACTHSVKEVCQMVHLIAIRLRRDINFLPGGV